MDEIPGSSTGFFTVPAHQSVDGRIYFTIKTTYGQFRMGRTHKCCFLTAEN
jgi:hypothetical protein